MNFIIFIIKLKSNNIYTILSGGFIRILGNTAAVAIGVLGKFVELRLGLRMRASSLGRAK
jgi:hypothetical protein